jgi:pentose-5-phosphate-3-epimerase
VPIVCPTITAYSPDEYKKQMEHVTGFAHRIQIDLTDGRFTRQKTVSPQEAWWSAGVRADFHLMYCEPLPAVKEIISHKPNLIIIHAEAEGDFNAVVDACHQHGVGVGVALLQNTAAETITPALGLIDHVLIFSGNLGYQGGSQADFRLLDKVKVLKSHKPQLEIGWDGVDVLYAGGYIQKSDNPARALAALQRIADETGTT